MKSFYSDNYAIMEFQQFKMAAVETRSFEEIKRTNETITLTLSMFAK